MKGVLPTSNQEPKTTSSKKRAEVDSRFTPAQAYPTGHVLDRFGV